MLKRILISISFIFAVSRANAQEIDKIINVSQVTQIEKTLSADDMEGRKIFTRGIEKAADFVADEFGKAGLQYWDSLQNYRQSFSIGIGREHEEQHLANIIGIIPGKSKKNEFVIFSSHYDHLGIGKPDARGDSIYNGANDDASGTTAVIMLARYFNAIKDNERTLVFVTFTAEEVGGYGSKYFSKHIDPDRVVAMFNIEMIGTESKWGQNSAYITGYDRSDFGKILQKNLEGSEFHFEPDPYPRQQLFFRSDNATLASLGVPAHTISTSKMDNEPNYHKQSDEIGTLDMANMTEIIKSIALSSKTIISGKDTPGRIEN